MIAKRQNLPTKYFQEKAVVFKNSKNIIRKNTGAETNDNKKNKVAEQETKKINNAVLEKGKRLLL